MKNCKYDTSTMELSGWAREDYPSQDLWTLISTHTNHITPARILYLWPFTWFYPTWKTRTRVGMLFIDFNFLEAFCCLICQTLVHKLNQRRLGSSICIWILDLLSNRLQRVRINCRLSCSNILNTGVCTEPSAVHNAHPQLCHQRSQQPHHHTWCQKPSSPRTMRQPTERKWDSLRSGASQLCFS